MADQWAAGLEILSILFSDARISLLLGLLLAAALTDSIHYRIPNLLVFPGAAFGLFYNAVFSGGLGLVGALEGMGMGLALLLPFYLLRAMGAGDVKLMAMTGAFLGPWDTLGAALGTFLAGGVLALLITLRAKAIGRMFRNIKTMFVGSFFKLAMGELPAVEAPAVSAGKLPYGAAIALGTSGFIVLHGFGFFYWYS
ncbi:MAG: A24 family peptidase [Sulfuricella sp.]|nr:A24 family peptidase [Sulfuricella sp.]